ncbi:uncharacterized protein MELLADRAFT_77938 [Melampsora larici-populina 98AG31]|uniref:Uncharacterized protein n=1 Tax=Melampsora larici-populina (strain 98AG31 / pathotype 3-4-7) TaxID=747676 RepID=F4RNL9_MELLP|nr:uncharacterized protein MELLADRAFT_77938 [Melampsora larici-populina 98AG31]EGG06067.1 hypothetical protein MELLADRAFT_77938 [Melampsora larici-populina 98AG31]
MAYQFEGPSSVPANFGWAGHQDGLNFASVPSSPDIGFGIPNFREHQAQYQLRSDTIQNEHDGNPSDEQSDSRINLEHYHPPSINMIHSMTTANSPLVGSAPTGSHIHARAMRNSTLEESWDSRSCSLATGNASSSEDTRPMTIGSSLMAPPHRSETRPRNGSSITIDTVGPKSDGERGANHSTPSMSTYTQVANSCTEGRIPIRSQKLNVNPLLPPLQQVHHSNGASIRHHHTSAVSSARPLPNRMTSIGSNVSTADNQHAKLSWYPLSDHGPSPSPQSSTGSSFSTCASPSSPYSSSWLGMRDSRNGSFSSHMSSRLPIGVDSWHIDLLSESPTSSSMTETAYTPDLWKMCELAQQASASTGDTLDQMIQRMREMGLDEDEIRMRLGGNWNVKDPEDEEDGHSDHTANDGTEPAISGTTSQRQDKKAEKGASGRKIENDTSTNSSTDPMGCPLTGTTDERKSLSSKTSSSAREPSIERGRRTRNTNRTVSYLDSALQGDSDVPVEMEWRAHSRSRSRPPETTNMDWRQASRSRSRRPAQFFDVSQPTHENETIRSGFFNAHLYKHGKASSLEGVRETSPAGSSLNSSNDFYTLFTDCDSSPSMLGSVEARSQQVSEHDAPEINQSSYHYPQDLLDKLVDQVHHANDSLVGSSGFDFPNGSGPMIPHQHRISQLDSGIIGLPTTPSYSTLLGSIPGLTEDFAEVANAHAEYGSIPRLVRKTSFDETLIQHRALSKLKRQSYLGPRGTHEHQGGATRGLDVGGSAIPDLSTPHPRPNTTTDGSRRHHHMVLPPQDTSRQDSPGYTTENALASDFNPGPNSISNNLEEYLCHLNSVSANSDGVSSSLPVPTSLSLANEGVGFDYLTPSAFQAQASKTGSGLSATSEENLNGSTHISNSPLPSTSLTSHTHSGLLNPSFRGASVSTLNSPLLMNSLSDYNMLLQFSQSLDDHGSNTNYGGLDQSNCESLTLLDQAYRTSESGIHTSVGISPQALVGLSEIQPLLTRESAPPVTINPAQLHPTPLRYSPTQSGNPQTINRGGVRSLIYPASVYGLDSSSIVSSDSSDSSRTSSLSSSTITGYQAPMAQQHLHASARSSEIPCKSSSTSSTIPTTGNEAFSTSTTRSIDSSPATSIAVSSPVSWNEHDVPERQKFSGGRSSHTSSIGQARQRSQQIPYGLTLNGTGTTGNVQLKAADELESENLKLVTENGTGVETSSVSYSLKQDPGTDEQRSLVGPTEASKPLKNSLGNERQSSTAASQCLNCETTVSQKFSSYFHISG